MTTPGLRPQRGQLQFVEVSKIYSGSDDSGPMVAVSDVTVAVGPDESVGVIGPNGAGKSTLLKLAAGVTAPTAGHVRRLGRTHSVIELGAGLHPDLTCMENFELLAGLGGLRGSSFRRELDPMVEFSGLASVLDRPARHLSTGMVARLAFSVAAHLSPDLLLLDEVMSVGDQEFQQRCRERLFELRNEGTTLFVVSHDLELIEDICERALVVEHGRVEYDGESAVAVRRYLGVPEPVVDSPIVTVELARTTVPGGTPLRFAVRTQGGSAESLRVDIVIRNHPRFHEVGQDFSSIFGSTRIDLGGRSESCVELATAGLPPGRFELLCTAESADRTDLGSSSTPIMVLGDPGPFAIRLPGEGRVVGHGPAPLSGAGPAPAAAP